MLGPVSFLLGQFLTLLDSVLSLFDLVLPVFGLLSVLLLSGLEHSHFSSFSDQINRLSIVEITPEQVADTVNDKPSCAICLEEMAVAEPVVKLNCTHLFHRPCIEPWLLRRTTCPTCRGPVEVMGGEEATGRIDGAMDFIP